MGYIKHDSIIVVGFDERVVKAHDRAIIQFKSLTSNLVEGGMNGYVSFFIGPDGSNEGWSSSEEFDKKRIKYKKFLDRLELKWVHVAIGNDYKQDTKIEGFGGVK